MATKITREVLEAYLNCKTKAYLKLGGQQGIVSDYEALLAANRQAVRQQAIGKILARNPEGEVARDIILTAAALGEGACYVLNAILGDDLLSLCFDGLKRVDGPSKLGDFHYVPMLFHEGRKVGKEQKLLLEVYGLLLFQIQGRVPANGLVWHGRECKLTRIRLNPAMRKAEALLRELKEMGSAESPPKLILNDHCQVCEFRQRCHKRAIEEDNLSLLRGLKEKTITKLNGKGIFTITQFSYTFRPRRRKRQKASVKKVDHSLQALSLRTKTIYVIKEPQLPACNVRVYLDIEGDPDREFYYLIGLLVCDGNTQEEYIYFWADTKNEEQCIWQAFLNYLSNLNNFCILHYGNYEKLFIRQMKRLYGCDVQLFEKLTSSAFNVLSSISAGIYFPVYSNSLKSIATHLGFKWSDQWASGIQALVWRHEWEEHRSTTLKERLVTYNREDCLALKTVNDSLEYLCHGSPQNDSDGMTKVINADEIKPERPYSFKRIDFCIPGMERINQCAYFDYQRERVHCRTNVAVRKSLQRERRRSRMTFRAKKEIFFEKPSQCPFCKSPHLYKNGVRSRMLYDLRKFAGGIKRSIVRYKTYRWRCTACDKTFLPESYLLIGSRFGSGLKAWSVYKHIALFQSYASISEELDELFGYRFGHTLVCDFKAEAAGTYLQTYNQLLKNLRTAHILYIDETKINLRGLSGYVWAFANMEQVVYVFWETREGTILKEILGDFKGVLVSDFYTAYDSVICPQQKCLIHLMRDINDDLLKNPFDEELKQLAHDFTLVLSSIVETIDLHGLKEYFLQKHRAPAKKFVKSVIDKNYKSEVCEKYQNRILNYRDNLFLFLNYDGVPWNNNIAEHAIKRVAFLRRAIGGSSTVKGIRQHLILLSVCETLRLHRVSFWDFLRSGVKDIGSLIK